MHFLLHDTQVTDKALGPLVFSIASAEEFPRPIQNMLYNVAVMRKFTMINVLF
jgi:hypothetical protein